MKNIPHALKASLLIPLMCLASFAGELPPEAQRLVNQRNDAIQKIDEKLVDELEKVKVKYTKSGDLDSANSIVKLIESLDIQNGHIQVTSPSEYSVHTLNVGVSRLTGLKWDSKFNWVAEDVNGWEFMRVKHQSNDTMTVTFQETGEIYITRLVLFKTSSIAVKKTAVSVKAKGPWQDADKQWYRVTGNKGDSFECDGPECFIVAKSFKKN